MNSSRSAKLVKQFPKFSKKHAKHVKFSEKHAKPRPGLLPISKSMRSIARFKKICVVFIPRCARLEITRYKFHSFF